MVYTIALLKYGRLRLRHVIMAFVVRAIDVLQKKLQKNANI